MFPKEHGAYGQLTFPLMTSFAVAGVSTPALLITLATVAGFIAHEPLLVLLGGRGPRARREEGRRAIIWLALSGAIALVAAIAAFWTTPTAVRWSFALPLLPASLLAATLVAKREKSALGENAVATAFSAVAVPLCLAAGASWSTALSVGVVFASIFVTGTLGVRLVILRARAGGNPHAVRVTRAALLLTAGAATAALATAAMTAMLPWAPLVAAAPGLALAVSLAVRPPPPTRLRVVGWLLVTTSAAASLVLITGLAR